MAGERLRLAALTVLGGSLHGRRYQPEEVVGEVLIGSDPDCHLVVDLPSVSPIHARVWCDLDASKVHDTHAPRGLYLNARRVESEAPLGRNDVLWLGPPGDPQSACVQLRFEPWVERLPLAAGTAEPAGVEAEQQSEGQPEEGEGRPEEAQGLPEEVEGQPEEGADELLVAAEPEPSASGEPGPVAEPASVGEEPGTGGERATVVEGPAPAAEPPAPFVTEPAPVAAEPAPDDPFFVAEAAAPDEPVPVAESAATDAASDAWAIREPAVGEAGVVAEEPVAGSPDEFFVADEPAGTAAEEPRFVEAEPVADTSAEPIPIELPPLLPTTPAKPAVVVPPAAPVLAEPHVPPPVTTATRPAPVPVPPAPTPAAVAPPSGAAVPAPAPTPAAAPPTPRVARPVAAPRPAAPHRPAASARRPPRPAAPRRSGVPGWLWPTVAGIGGLAVVAVLGVLGWRMLAARVRLETVTPVRVRVGQRATLAGRGFAGDAPGNVVLFDDKPARVLAASPARLEVEVPPSAGEAGGERQAAVVVRVGTTQSNAVSVTVIQGPRLHGISPAAAMPGEEVVLAGAGWGVGAAVRFGGVLAQTVEVGATRIRAIVPPIAAGPGTSAPVVVTVGGVESNAAPFVVGHLPLVTAVSPPSAGPGDVVQVSGLGFASNPELDEVRVAGVPALVVSAAPDSLKLVVPQVGPGDPARVLEVRVQGTANVGQGTLQVPPPADPVEARFVAEPFVAASRRHALLATGVGPAFVLAAAGGRSAAERALEAENRLNAAVPLLRSTAGLTIEARGLDASPVLGLSGRPEVLLDVTEEDAAAYNEDWTGLKGRGGRVTPGRLARWWEAVARDLVLLTIRGERPRYAAALGSEGRALGQLFDAARKTGRAGVPLQVVSEARAPLREGLRLIALRVPATVSAPATAASAPGGAAAASASPPPRLSLDGSFRGHETEEGQLRYLTVAFSRGGGSITYEGGITFSVPLLSLEQRGRDQLRFSVRMRGGVRYYSGRWDGERLTGTLSKDSAGREVVGSFELRR
ncbi:MAG: IPT/TIG domain-containing protein [Betaproteobacteria bacterium]